MAKFVSWHNILHTWNASNSETFILEVKNTDLITKTLYNVTKTSKQAFRISCAKVSALSFMFFTAARKTHIQENNMASRSCQVTGQPKTPRLHGACILAGHILVNERFHGSEIVKALQGLSVAIVLFCLTGKIRTFFAPKFKFENNTKENHKYFTRLILPLLT